MTTSKNHKYNQAKWLYSSLSGLCAAYFLALLSGGANLENSILLVLSTLCFSVCLPIFVTFAVSHVYMHDLDTPVEICDKALNEPWVNRVTIGGFGCLFSAFMFLIGHFSIAAMIGFIIVSALCIYCFFEFAVKLTSQHT
jgi:hypothetical protein